MARSIYDFAGDTVLVTGGTQGIGWAIASAFREAGAWVIVTGTRPSAADYETDLSAFSYRRCVMTERRSIDALVESITNLDVLVNNAGQTSPGGRSEYEQDVFEDVVAVHLFAPFRIASGLRSLLGASRIDGGGSIVNVGSMTSFFGHPSTPAYGAAKAGVVQLTKTLAIAYAPDRIRVNAIAPGIVQTRMTARLATEPSLERATLDRTPLGRLGQPVDIAPAALFLASDSARYITGETLRVDGGYSVRG